MNFFKSLALMAISGITALAQIPSAGAPSAPLQVFSISGGAGTFSLAPFDFLPVRSLFGVYETNRNVTPSEVTIITDVLVNAQPTAARFLQRKSNRGTTIVLIEVNARPTIQGKAAMAGFEVRLAGSFAGTIDTSTPVSVTQNNQLFYVESNGSNSGTFSVVYPIGMTIQVAMNTWDPFTQTDWQPQIPVSPETIGNCNAMEVGLGSNMRAFYDVSQWPGLINVSGTLDNSASWAHDCFLNLNTRKNEWTSLTILPIQ